MDTDTLPGAYVAFELEFVDHAAILGALDRYASDLSEYQPVLIEILSINVRAKSSLDRLVPLLRELMIEAFPDFDLGGPESETFARSCFEQRIRDYLAGECTPWEVCRVVQPIEQVYDFPAWLGNAYDLCDWIEEDTRPVDCRYLESGLRELLRRAGAR